MDPGSMAERQYQKLDFLESVTKTFLKAVQVYAWQLRAAGPEGDI